MSASDVTSHGSTSGGCSSPCDSSLHVFFEAALVGQRQASPASSGGLRDGPGD